MNFTKGANIHNTCLQGIVSIDYKTLVEIFGNPNYGPDMNTRDKVSCEWDLKFEDGMIATIYDWREEWTTYSTYPWHIGGHSQAAFQRIMKLIENHQKTAAKESKKTKQEPVAWVNQEALDDAAVQRKQGGQAGAHVWSETPTSYFSVPLYAAPQI